MGEKKGNKGHKEADMMAGKGGVGRLEFTEVRENAGGPLGVQHMKDGIWMGFGLKIKKKEETF